MLVEEFFIIKGLKKYKFILLILALFVSNASAEVFYVSPGGDDSGAGTIDAPWATLKGARNNVRAYLDGNGDITVYLRGGTYILDQTVVYGLKDDGTANQSITYAAYRGETPIISSLVQVTGWTNYRGNIKQAYLPAGIGHVRFLQDSRASVGWLDRSSTNGFEPQKKLSDLCGGVDCPENNEAETYTPHYQKWKTKIIPTKSGWIQPDWSKVTQYDLRVIADQWAVDVYPIASRSGRKLNLAIPSLYPMLRSNDEEGEYICEAWIVNSIAGIDKEGEWACIDGKIYLYPVGSNTDNIYVPQLIELIRVDAGADSAISLTS